MLTILNQKKIELNPTITFFLPLLFILLISCSPQTKEAYLNEFGVFVSEVDKECANYSEEEWLKATEKFDQFSVEWFEAFEDDFTWKDEIIVLKYQTQFHLLKSKTEATELFDLFLKDDFEKLKKELLYYKENEMNEDIDFLMKQAEDVGEYAVKALEELMVELDLSDDSLSK